MENSLNQNKVWGWGELALMYFPNISQKSATMQLLKWIRVSDELVGQLEKSGWHPDTKKLKVLRYGLHLGMLKKNRFEPSHALSHYLKMEDVKNVENFSVQVKQ